MKYLETYRGVLLRYCNCADCRRLLLGDSLHEWRTSSDAARKMLPPCPRARIKGRPYCHNCYHAFMNK